MNARIDRMVVKPFVVELLFMRFDAIQDTAERAEILAEAKQIYEEYETQRKAVGFQATSESVRMLAHIQLAEGDLGAAIQKLKQAPGKGLFVGGVKLALALTEMGLIDEYEFVVQPRVAGHGPTLFAELSKHIDLKLVDRLELGSGAVALRYERRA